MAGCSIWSRISISKKNYLVCETKYYFVTNQNLRLRIVGRMSSILNLSIFEQRFRNIFREAPFSAALLSGSDFVVEMANEVSLQLWGKDESIIGKPLLIGMPEMRDQPVFKILENVFHSGETFEGKEQTAFLRIEGQLKKIYVNFVFKAVRDDDDNITAILAVGYDVTDQVEAKQNLQASEARVRLSIDAVGFGTFEKDLIANRTITSDRFDRIFGFAEGHVHDDYLERIHPDDKRLRDKAHLDSLQSGKISYETRIILPDQSIRWVKIDGLIIFDQHQIPIRLMGTARDITEERESHMRLVESEERFRALISETPEVGAGFYTGPEFRIQYVNDVMLRFWGKTRDVIGKTFIEAVPELRDQPFLEQIEKVYSTGNVFEGKEQLALLEVDGHLKRAYFNYTYKALRNPKGEIYAIHHMAVDVTKQVESKAALIESEKRVIRLFEQTPVGIAVFKGKDFVIEMVNETILRYWGRTRKDVMGKPLWQALPEVAAQGIEKITEEVFNTGTPYSSPETTLTVLRNGKMEIIVVNFAFIPDRDVNGDIIGLIGIANDVTDLVNARKKVEKNETRLQHLANSMPQVVWIAEEDGTVSYYNDRVKAFGGVTRAGESWIWEGTLHPDDVASTSAVWMESVQNKTVYQKEHRVLMSDGTYRWHLSRGYPFDTEEGIKWYGTATDVHDQKVLEMHLEFKVKERTLELERSNDDLQQFAHVASHDLKEPVRKVKTFSHKLQSEYKDVLGERGNKFVNKVIDASVRMSSMIDGVLEYASLSSVNTTPQQVNISEVIENIKNDLEVLIQEKEATIHAKHLPVVTGVPDLLYQLFYNLINNSLKFSRSDVPALITVNCIEVVKDGVRYFEIVLRDNGIGFDEAYGEQIFQTFFRLNSKDKFEGSGLGLSLCKKIVERHGGFIQARGEQNKGAEFFVYLPMR